MIGNFESYCEKLGANTTECGGGSATGVVLALSVSCFEKAFAFSEKIGDIELSKKIRELKNNAIKLAEDDSIYFARWQKARKLPKGSEAERKVRDEEVKKYSELSAIVPLECANQALVLLEMIEKFIADCPFLLISDLGIALTFIEAVFRSSKLNMLINIKYIKDEEVKNKLNHFLLSNEKEFYQRASTLQIEIEKQIMEFNSKK